MRKFTAVAISLLLSSSAFAGTSTEIKLLNASSPLKTMVFTYNICDSDSNKCYLSNQTTDPLKGSEFGGIGFNVPHANLIITKIVETEDGKEVARAENVNGVCKATFGIDSTLIFNDYGTPRVVCSYGYTS